MFKLIIVGIVFIYAFSISLLAVNVMILQMVMDREFWRKCYRRAIDTCKRIIDELDRRSF